MISDPRIETLLAHAGCTIDPATGALTPALHFATTFQRDTEGGYDRGYVYSRWNNPTRHLLETTLAQLEGGTEAAVFSAGMAGVMTVLQALPPKSHIILPDDIYHGVRKLLRDTFAPRGLTYTEVDQTDLAALDEALQTKTALVWAETPSNPLVKISDLHAICKRAHAAGAQVLVDGTWTTPVLQQPFAWGADFVLHSVTKYLAGHSDVLGGVIVTREENPLFEQIRSLQMGAGAVMAPFDCWLTLRGLRSLSARLRIHCENAQQIAAFLAEHPRVSAVFYPGLPQHAGHAIAQKQMRGMGGMLSFQVHGGRDAAMAVAQGTRLFVHATSLGGTESLIEHRESIESKPTNTPPDLLRLSIGLEHADDLIADLDHALTVV